MVLRAQEIDTWLASISKLVFSKSDRMLPDWLYDRLSHKTKLLLVALVPLVEPSNQLVASPSQSQQLFLRLNGEMCLEPQLLPPDLLNEPIRYCSFRPTDPLNVVQVVF